MLITTSSYSQINKYDFGVEGGIGLAWLYGEDHFKDVYNARMGFSGGMFFQFNCKKLWSVRTGVFVDRKGSAFKILATDNVGNDIGEIDGKENFDYLSVPVLFRLSGGKKLKHFINAGPYIGFLLKQSLQYDKFLNYPKFVDDNTDSYKKTEVGISFGGGIAYKCTQQFSITLEVRNNLGLTNTSKETIYNDATIKTEALNFLVGLNFHFGQREVVTTTK